MKKADNFDAGKWLVENKITKQSRLNEESLPTKVEKDEDFVKVGNILKKNDIPYGWSGGETGLLIFNNAIDRDKAEELLKDTGFLM